ncbi:hypothetical protein SAMN02927921_02894 [Sinomicrobium oceani]|uniref:Lipoprotein n=1 Tax=Sinomicrobium oceani TaxID=1150368 RepID=A0A1K1QVA3_9FLAO|nr:hypothetical protein [Sinomicrobium oceani]SFW63890.1 hypothetical protein SAMN02927921_02894 [Sinomicrobium oceani]
MVKNRVLLVLMFILGSIFSCKTWIHTSEGGFWPKKPKFSLISSGNNNENSRINTVGIYRLYRTYMGEDNFSSNERMYDKLVSDDEYYKNRPIPILRFYDNFRYRSDLNFF